MPLKGFPLNHSPFNVPWQYIHASNPLNDKSNESISLPIFLYLTLPQDRNSLSELNTIFPGQVI